MNISLSRNYFANPNGEIVRKSVRNVVSKFEDDPTVNESRIVVLLRQVWLYAGKRENLGIGKEENEFGSKKECGNIP